MEAAARAIPFPGRSLPLQHTTAPASLIILQHRKSFRPPLQSVMSAADSCTNTSIGISCSSSSVASSFTAEAPIGPVECYARGCRPVYDDDEACHAYNDEDELGGGDGQQEKWDPPMLLAWQEQSGANGGSVACQMQRLLSSRGLWAEDVERAERYYESAVLTEPRNSVLLLEYALFAWNALADAQRADDLFHRALALAPSNHSILASYASFLWQTEAST